MLTVALHKNSHTFFKQSEIFRQRPGWPYQLCLSSMLLHKYFVQHACEHGQTSFSFCHVRLLETGGGHSAVAMSELVSDSTWLGEQIKFHQHRGGFYCALHHRQPYC